MWQEEQEKLRDQAAAAGPVDPPAKRWGDGGCRQTCQSMGTQWLRCSDRRRQPVLRPRQSHKDEATRTTRPKEEGRRTRAKRQRRVSARQSSSRNRPNSMCRCCSCSTRRKLSCGRSSVRRRWLSKPRATSRRCNRRCQVRVVRFYQSCSPSSPSPSPPSSPSPSPPSPPPPLHPLPGPLRQLPHAVGTGSLTLIGGQARGGLARKGFEDCSKRGKKRKTEKKREKIRNNKFLISFFYFYFFKWINFYIK